MYMAKAKTTNVQDCWEDALTTILPSVCKITTHNGTGTGFILSVNGPEDSQIYGLATAYHVISTAYELDMPIRITHYSSNNFVVLKADPNSRIIYPIPNVDLAFILFNKSSIGIDINPAKMMDPGSVTASGKEIGWAGFPSVAPALACFFHGYISSSYQYRNLLKDFLMKIFLILKYFYLEFLVLLAFWVLRDYFYLIVMVFIRTCLQFWNFHQDY